MLPEMKDGMRIRRNLTGMRDADIFRDLCAEGNGSGGTFAGSVTGWAAAVGKNRREGASCRLRA